MSFVSHDAAINYLAETIDPTKMYRLLRKGEYIYLYCRFVHKVGFEPCRATLRLRKSKRYVTADTLAEVYELYGCAKHNHEIIYETCKAEHEHTWIDEEFKSQEEAEERFKNLTQFYVYRRRFRSFDKRIFLGCKGRGKARATKCYSIAYIYPSIHLNNPKYYLKGCFTHNHEPNTKDLLCAIPHEHQIIDMTFSSMEEFTQYMTDNDMENSMKKYNYHASANGKVKIHNWICNQHVKWQVRDQRYKRKIKKDKVDYHDCPAHFTMVEPLKVKGEKIKMTGCVTHNHEVQKTRISLKFKNDVFARMDAIGITEEQKFRAYRRFRTLVLDMKKTYGSDFLDAFDGNDVDVSKELIAFKDHFLDKYPKAANVKLCSTQKSGISVKTRREVKKKRILEKLKYVHHLIEDMELTEENEEFMDKTVNALKLVPGLKEAFARAPTKRLLNNSEVQQSIAKSPPKKRKKKVAEMTATTREEIQHEPQVISIDDHYYVTSVDNFSYSIVPEPGTSSSSATTTVIFR